MTIDQVFRLSHGLTESEAVAVLCLLKAAKDAGQTITEDLIQHTIYRINPAAGQD